LISSDAARCESKCGWVHVDLNGRESGCTQSLRKLPRINDRRPIKKMQSAKEQAGNAIGTRNDASRTQHSRYFAEYTILAFWGGQMMQHVKTNRTIEGGVPEAESAGVAS